MRVLRDTGGPAPDAQSLRAGAEAAAAGLPALVLAAERLAAGFIPGAHGQRRSGTGEEFWQYRPAAPGEETRAIDWRRSARSDATYVREREAVTARTALFWVDPAPGMGWRGDPARPAKRDRAALLALALGLVLIRGGERVAALGAQGAGGRVAADRLAEALVVPGGPALPDLSALRSGARVVLISDFFAPLEGWQRVLAQAAAQGVSGVALQLLDPVEEGFPFAGALRFLPAEGGRDYETRDAGALAAAYRERLAQRRAALTAAAGAAGWVFGHDVTDAAPAATLGWLYAALGG